MILFCSRNLQSFFKVDSINYYSSKVKDKGSPLKSKIKLVSKRTY